VDDITIIGDIAIDLGGLPEEALGAVLDAVQEAVEQQARDARRRAFGLPSQMPDIFPGMSRGTYQPAEPTHPCPECGHPTRLGVARCDICRRSLGWY
jgi:hypothetical protein